MCWGHVSPVNIQYSTCRSAGSRHVSRERDLPRESRPCRNPSTEWHRWRNHLWAAFRPRDSRRCSRAPQAAFKDTLQNAQNCLCPGPCPAVSAPRMQRRILKLCRSVSVTTGSKCHVNPPGPGTRGVHSRPNCGPEGFSSGQKP